MQLLQHFKNLTLHPKNAQELTGLILQLAVQGKLTAKWRSENPDIEPSSELLKRIKKERNQLIKGKKVRKGKANQLIKNDEKYLEIPNKWEWARIIEIGDLFNGNSINKSLKEAKYEGLEEGYPYLGTKDINFGFEELNYENGVRIPFDEPKFKIAHKNTALICSEGGSAGKKCGITTEDICFGNKLYALEQYGGLEAVYILSIYKTPIFFEIFQSKMTGIIGGISINNFGDIPIPIPPLAEQKEIVKTVEILFKEVEQLDQLTHERISLKEDFANSALQQLTTNNATQEWAYLQAHFKSFFNETTNIKKLRETILQLAVQGKLTADWREQQSLSGAEVEDASILFKRIQKEKAQLIKDKKIKKEKPLPTITEDEIPYELPEGWVWCRLGNTLLYSDSGKSPDCEKRPVLNKEWGVLTTTSIQQNKFVESANKVLPHNFEINPKQIVEVGDILITRAGPINRTGIACKVDKLQFNLILSDKTIRLKYIEESLFPDFIVLTLNSESIRKLLLGKMIGMASSQVNISQANIKGICFPLPPLEEQKAIVQKVNALMGLCDGLEQEVQQSQEQIEQLMQSCLREVFEGYSENDEALRMVAEEDLNYTDKN